MINLPKPSQFRMDGSYSDQIDYLRRYLATLVTALEKYLGGLKGSTGAQTTASITDISYNDGKLIISKDDGSEQIINIGEQ